MNLPSRSQAITLVLMDARTGLNFSILGLVKAHHDDGGLSVSILLPENTPAPAANTRAALMWGHEGKAWMAVCAFTSLEPLPSHDDLVDVRLAAPRRTYSINRRSAFRIDLEMALNFRIVDIPEHYETKPELRASHIQTWRELGLTEPATSRDLGAGGISFYTSTLIPKGAGIILSLILPEREVYIAARCVSERTSLRRSSGERCYALQFLGMEGPDLDHVSRLALQWEVNRELTRS